MTDKKAELKKLNRSILICFLELLDILINDPASPAVSEMISQPVDNINLVKPLKLVSLFPVHLKM